MRKFTAVIEKDPETGLFVGYVPGFPGAHRRLHFTTISFFTLTKVEPSVAACARRR